MTEWLDELPPWIVLSVGTEFRDVSVSLTLGHPVPAHTSYEDDILKLL